MAASASSGASRYDAWSVQSPGEPLASSLVDSSTSSTSSSSSSSSSSTSGSSTAVLVSGRGPVFRMPLRAVMIDQGRGYVPYVIEKCMVFLKNHMAEEGLFRVPGADATVNRLVAAFDSGEDVVLERYTTSPHDVASLMKAFFTQLPEPLIPTELVTPLFEALAAVRAGSLEPLRRVCDQIPEYPRALLECLLKFLREVLRFKDANKMTIPNFSVVFGPTLIRLPVPQDHSEMVKEVRDMNEAVAALMTHVDPLFGIYQIPGGLTSTYEVGRKLGAGSFATVYLVKHRVTGVNYAAKVIKKSSLAYEDRLRLESEVDILRRIRHPAIISLVSVCETASDLILVMELAEGGELFEKLVKDGKYTESDAVRILKQLLSALEYLHGLHIVHRDLKPENILLRSKDSKDIKIADFGLSKIFSEIANFKSICGSPGFVAPEILQETPYGPEVDMWSTGVIAYILLSGVPPFYASNMKDLFGQIKKGDYNFPSPYWDNVSEQGKEFVRSLLVLDPTKRPSATEALQHPFMMGRSETLDAIKMAAILNRTAQLSREQSKLAIKQLVKGEGAAPPPKPAPAPVAPTPSGGFSNPHRWVKTQYNAPTWCDGCTKFLWGLRYQGVQCTDCKMNLHKKCSQRMGDNCLGNQK